MCSSCLAKMVGLFPPAGNAVLKIIFLGSFWIIGAKLKRSTDTTQGLSTLFFLMKQNKINPGMRLQRRVFEHCWCLGCGLCTDTKCPHALFSELMQGIRGRWQLVHLVQGKGLQLCSLALQGGAECLYWHFLVWGVVSRNISEELSPLGIEYFPTVWKRLISLLIPHYREPSMFGGFF